MIRNIKYLFVFVFALSYSQKVEVDSLRGKFTYLLSARPNTLYPDRIYKELFSLQISDNRSFFMSENLLKIDSIYTSQYKKGLRNKKNGNVFIDLAGLSIPSRYSKYLIIQNNASIDFYGRVGNRIYSYSDKKINNWSLLDDSKIINSFSCRKAKVHFKGRDWIAWYTLEIPFAHGPAKFSGLPGLIIKIYDTNEDYIFELVQSEPTAILKDQLITVNKRHYKNAIEIGSKKEFVKLKDRIKQEDRVSKLERMGMQISSESKRRIRLNQIEKNKRRERDKKGYNPIELE